MENNNKEMLPISVQIFSNDVTGIYYRVLPGHCLISENLFGDGIKIKGPGIHLLNPLKKNRPIYLEMFTVYVNFDTSLNNSEGWELSLEPVTFKMHVDVKKDEKVLAIDLKDSQSIDTLLKLNRRKGSLSVLQDELKKIVKDIVLHSMFEQLKDFSLDKDHKPSESYTNKSTLIIQGDSSLSDEEKALRKSKLEKDADYVKGMLSTKIEQIKEEFGIVIDDIIFGDINLPGAINTARVNKEKVKLENEANLSKANADYQVAKMQADGQIYLKEKDYRLLANLADEGKISPQGLAEILKRYATSQNATFIEANGGLDAYTAMLYNGFTTRYSREKQFMTPSSQSQLVDLDAPTDSDLNRRQSK